ncbi:MAG: amylo-alpha-1,6-glucosidase [Patescibacteria group bacterium]|nr:amylo-alpha-1,6-glucosidase [Patescibacteria group bacterium]
MKVTHIIKNNKKLSKECSGVESFLISNEKGDYLWMNSEPQSRYEGWFCSFEKLNNIYRIIENISIEGSSGVDEITNYINRVERKRGDLVETFRLSHDSSVFDYQLNKKRKINIFFDVRESYSSEKYLDYEVESKKDIIFISFNKKIFLAVKSEKGSVFKEKINRHYQYDQDRNSFPFHREVSYGLSLYGKRFTFSVAESKKKALEGVKKRVFSKLPLETTKQIDDVLAKEALSSLLISIKKRKGLFAGLPWFFQFWPRDEAISLKAMSLLKKEESKEVFFRLLKTSFLKRPRGVVNIDAPGWLLKRADCFLPLLSSSEKEVVKRKGKLFIKKASERMVNGFFVNNSNETWMDSLERDGARIEIQAMLLNGYRLLAELSKTKKEKDFYIKKEEEMKKRVRDVFFENSYLYDGYYPKTNFKDFTVRPNIFIAFYIYPELLSKEEWVVCFQKVLDCLWLSWGGLSTIDKNSSNFHWKHTGEDSRSYHQGDSWFFLNNLVAIVLYKTDKKRFKDYIEKIKEASKEELMWMGAVGCHGEVSSAEKLESRGCLNQAWSSAMYLELKQLTGDN